MAEAPKQDSQTQFETQTPLVIQKIYAKDISFETPNSPQIFLYKKQWEPEVSITLSHNSFLLNEDIYEVVLGITVTAKVNDKTAYLAEVHLAGIFKFLVRDSERVSTIIGGACPQILFPYAREVISDLVTRGGFPSLVLEPINFIMIYKQHVEREQLTQAEENKQDQAGEN
jgi:preprotein translocase subunit SecB